MKVLEFEIVHRRLVANYDLVRLLDLKFLSELAATMVGTSNPPH
jgi:hypothetical protein